MVGRSPEIERLVAIRAFPDTRKLWGAVVVYLDHQCLAGCIDELTHIHILARQFDTRIRPLHDKST